MGALFSGFTGTREPWVPVDPVTVNFTVADLADAFFGFFDKTVTRSSVAAWDWRVDQSTLTFYARGTSCTVQLGESATNGFSISVDDGAWSLIGGVAGFNTITAFTGQTDTEHLVRIVSSPGFNGGGAYTRASGNIVSVTGANPLVRAVGVTYHVTDPSLPGQWYSITDAAIGGNYTPAYRISTYGVPAAPNTEYSRNTGIGTLRGSGSEFWIYSGNPRCQYAVDGGSWSEVTFPANLGSRTCMRQVATGLDGSTHTYKVIGSRVTGSTGNPLQGMALGPVATATYGSATTLKKWAMFGDSITQAMNDAAQYTGHGDLFVSGQAIGVLGLHVGKSGRKAADLDTDITTILDGTTLSAPDVAIIAIGANDAATVEANFKTSYASIISKILAAGVPQILCRTVVPNNSGSLDATVSQWIADVVTSTANPVVDLIDATTWRPITTYDGQHPTNTGYSEMAAYEVTPYTTYV